MNILNNVFTKFSQMSLDVRISNLFQKGINKPFYLILIFVLFSRYSVQANVVGNGNQNFNPIASGLDFVTVHSSETLRPGIWNFSFFLNNAVNSLPYFENTNQDRFNINDNLLSMDLGIGMGITNKLEFGVHIPFIITQSIQSEQTSHGQFSSWGYAEFRGYTKYKLAGNNNEGIALIGSINLDQTRNNIYLGTNPGPTFNVEIAADKTIRKTAYAVNLGYRKVNAGSRIPNSPVDPIGDQIIYSAAVSRYSQVFNTKAIAEVYGSSPVTYKDSNTNRNSSSLEFLLGLKYDKTTNLAFHVGGGTEVIHGVSSPDWRIYSGINYSFNKDKVIPQNFFSGDRITLSNLEFDFDSDQLAENQYKELNVVYDYWKKSKFVSSILIIGHTDSIGDEQYNLELSKKRALAIKNVLIEKYNIPSNLLSSDGKGESDPIADNGNFQGRQQNRRVEIIFIK